MTRLSGYFLPTVKEAPADAEAISHVLMVRAGLVRQLGAGMWTWLPAGWRVHRRIEQIIREELDAIGAQEMLMPVLQPEELWRRTGRSEIPELFRLRDRNERPLVLAMTHEEAVTYHVSREIRSYRDLPLILYHFQVKERDEPRPRAGVLRTREFVMKDSYSFDRDEPGLEESYARHITAYDRIFDRAGLRWYRVESDVGMMGGLGAHEYMAPCPAGENEVALSDAGYAANVEIATGDPPVPSFPDPLEAPEPVETPDSRTIEEVSALLGVDPGTLIKALPVVGADGRTTLVLVRGDHTMNEIKLQNALGEQFRPASEEEIVATFGAAPGFIGPVGVAVDVLADSTLENGVYVTGANRDGYHLRGVEPGRDFKPRFADVRKVEEGDRCPNGGTIHLEPAIEVGNIFKLGTRYSEPLGAHYLDEAGNERPVVMGSYGIGPARIAAAAVEQYADDQGISWPASIAPFEVELVTLGRPGTEERELGERLYGELTEAGVDVLFDDRDTSPGEKFVEAELLGCPLRVVAGRRSLELGELEVQVRRGMEKRAAPLEGAADALRALLDELP
jgi:prolyl-tRNA synthetase